MVESKLPRRGGILSERVLSVNLSAERCSLLMTTPVRRSIQRLLESVGLKVETFGTATDYLAAEDGRPGCLVADVRTPGLSGLDLQEEMVNRGINRPIIFITAHGDIPMSVCAMKAGAIDFIPKPFNEQFLLDAVNRALQKDAEQRIQNAEREEIEQGIAQLTSGAATFFSM